MLNRLSRQSLYRRFTDLTHSAARVPFLQRQTGPRCGTVRPMRTFFLSCLLLLLCAAQVHALDVTIRVSTFKVDFPFQYTTSSLMDGDPGTAWVSGSLNSGEGQWIELTFDKPTRVKRIGIYNGHHGVDDFESFRRIRTGRIQYPDGSETKFWLRDERGEQIIECRGTPQTSLRLLIDGVFPEGELFAKVKVAVSEIKLYVLPDSYAGNPDDLPPAPTSVPTTPPVEPVPEGVADILRQYYVRLTTMADDYPLLFAEDVRDRNDFRFEVFKSVQMQRGTYAMLRKAQVDPSGLGFEVVEREGQYVEVRVFGGYRVTAEEVDTVLEEDSTFVLSEEPEGWRILEIQGEEPL